MRYVVESKIIRELLTRRIMSLRACGHDEAADQLALDLQALLQEEQFINSGVSH